MPIMKLSLVVLVLCHVLGNDAWAADVAWEGRTAYRILVKIESVELGTRATDELVASYDLDLDAIDSNLPQHRAIDFDSVQIMRYSPTSGQAEKYANHAYASSPFDRPFQFYDGTYPEKFPDYERYLSHQKDAPFLRPKIIPWGARHFNAIGDGRQGRLVWPHTQQHGETSHYAIYFNLLPQGTMPISPPAGFTGDGSSRAVRESNRFGPPGNINGRVVDWNGDQLPDLLFGSSDGHLSIFLNSGRPGEPRLRTKRLLLDASGVPIDVGFSSCPCVIDWNSDGKNDLLVGAEKGCVVWYQNTGSNAEPNFRFNGFLESAGQMIVTPAKPIAEGRGEEVFKEDYFPVPLAVDWDGDADLDLLLGGFVTGLTFLYENTASPGQMPELKLRGPLLDHEGQVIDTGWQAAPATADLDNDGDLDLVLGGKPVKLDGGDTRDPLRAIFYYQNTGTRQVPKLVRTEFPADTPPPFGGMGVPSLSDWNGDGLIDLIVVDARQQVFAFPNRGTAQRPRFDLTTRPLMGSWQSEGIRASEFADVNGDGFADVLNGFNVMLSSGKPSPGLFPKRLLFGAGKIKHPVAHGDENPGLLLYDFNGDGALDGIYGGHSGHIWLHVNRGSNLKSDLDIEGQQLRLVSGAPLKVGLPEGAKIEKFDFTVLQGARPKPVAADFNQDGLPDLMIADTYGKVRYFENRGTRAAPVFAEPVLIDDRRSRLYISTLDWNGDKIADVAVLKGGVHIFVNKGIPGSAQFHPPETIQLPPTQGYLLSLSAFDWNRDGDDDLLYLAADGSFCFAERSFLKFGYRAATRIAIETK